MDTIYWIGEEISLKTLCYCVPDYKAQLMSPHCLFKRDKGVTGNFYVEEDQATLIFDRVIPLVIEYDTIN